MDSGIGKEKDMAALQSRMTLLKSTTHLILQVTLLSVACFVNAAEHSYDRSTIASNQTIAKQNDGNLVIHHQHNRGQWMVGYKYVNSYMDGLIRGSEDNEGNEAVSTQDISRSATVNPLTAVTGFNYLMSPTDMTTQTHMLMAMYGYNDDISLMFMTHFVQKKMNMVTHIGNAAAISNTINSTMESSGVGDSLLTLMINFDDNWTNSFGFSLPTGSIDQKVIMNGTSVQAPYQMQLSSGTFDFLQSITYSAVYENFDWGVQENFTYRHGINNNGYVLGNRFEINSWIRLIYANQLSISARINMFNQSVTQGRDSKIINPTTALNFDSANSGRHETNFSLGISKSFNERHSIGFEYTKPIMQEVLGVQMKSKNKFGLSWSYQL